MQTLTPESDNFKSTLVLKPCCEQGRCVAVLRFLSKSIFCLHLRSAYLLKTFAIVWHTMTYFETKLDYVTAKVSKMQPSTRGIPKNIIDKQLIPKLRVKVLSQSIDNRLEMPQKHDNPFSCKYVEFIAFQRYYTLHFLNYLFSSLVLLNILKPTYRENP